MKKISTESGSNISPDYMGVNVLENCRQSGYGREMLRLNANMPAPEPVSAGLK